ncbi:MAG: 5-methyltetrahydropteroyltriglutamate--homocysteine S-methyltransferase, partial [Candidatus Omnitrophica bacterium]|nr:5-methyltetrahydropteroyltriglutamate--homocysteine S-methyltransferase [Candidatus Omnitrophota bacterium]
MKTYAYGFPRLGRNREYKKIIEKLWGGQVKREEVFSVLLGIQKENIRAYKDNKIDLFPEGEMSFYDPMLDTAILCGLYNP